MSSEDWQQHMHFRQLMQLKNPRIARLTIIDALALSLNLKCNLLRTGPIALVAWTATGWSKRIRLQKVSQLDLEIKVFGKVADQTLKMRDGFCCKLLFVKLK